MVFQKKGAIAVKNTQANKKKGKKAFEADDAKDLDMFEDMDDSDDFEDDSDEDMPVQKTPQNKTPKGRQSMSEKKVSFGLPNKTPAKTPQKNNSLIAKKTPTPAGKGKVSLQEVKETRGKALQKKAAEDDDSDEDDDEEEDLDFEIEGMDEEDVDEDSDEEEEEGDDDEDDDEEEEDEEEEDEEEKKPNLMQQKNGDQLKQKSPVKGTKIVKGNQTSKMERKEKNGSKNENKKEKGTVNTSESQIAEIRRRRERDSKSLYLGNLPTDVTAEELKGLSKDIKEVIIPRTREYAKRAFAFLTFDSEAKAEANYKILQSKKFRNQPLSIDYVGEKSTKQPVVIEEKRFNMLKLYVAGVPVDATLDEVCKYFPKANEVKFNRSPMFRSASISFLTEKDANEAFVANKEIEVNGHTLVVVHSTASARNQKNRRFKNKRKNNRNNQNNQGNPPKKIKFTKQAEEESSDEE